MDYDVWLKKQKQNKKITTVLILSKPYPGMWRYALHGVRPLQFQLCCRPFHTPLFLEELCVDALYENEGSEIATAPHPGFSSLACQITKFAQLTCML